MKRWFAAGFLALVSASAAAEGDHGFFMAASGGSSKFDVSKGELDSAVRFAYTSNGVTVLSSTSSFDDKGSAWSLQAGYRMRFLSVEGGYVDLGSVEHRSTSVVRLPRSSVSSPSNIAVDLSAKGLFVELSAIGPIGKYFDVHGHLGTLYSQTKLNVRVDINNTSVPQNEDSYAADVFAGAGATVHFTPNFGATVDYTFFNDVGGGDNTGEGDITAIRFGLQYIF